jgi:hypothetical protein
MELTGRCYCGQVHYRAEGEPAMRAQCHCRECQYISGGAAVLIMGMPAAGFSVTRGEAKAFTRSDIPRPVTREFCPNCGTHLLTRVPDFPLVFLKIGTLDDPSLFRGPDAVLFTIDQQPWHLIPDGVPSFPGMPG